MKPNVPHRRQEFQVPATEARMTAITTIHSSSVPLRNVFTSSSEAEVLQCLRRPPIELGCVAVVPSTRGEVPRRAPRSRGGAGGGGLLEARLGGSEFGLRLVEPVLLQQRAP